MTRLKNLILILFLFKILLLLGCGKQEFSYIRGSQKDSLSKREPFSNSSCALSTQVKPKVDILFLFDNSTSSFFLNQEDQSTISRALERTISVSSRFNYRIMVAPLLSASLTAGVSIVVYNQDDITNEGRSLIVENGNALVRRASSIQAIGGSSEYGFERAKNLIDYHNKTTKIFRENSHFITVLFSNEDDDCRTCPPNQHYIPPSVKTKDFNKNLEALKNLYGNLDSTQFRFVTVVPHSEGESCPLRPSRMGRRYKKMSEAIYDHNNLPPNNQHKDSYDLCHRNYDNIFEQIDGGITEVTVPHIYDYWPITDRNSGVGGRLPFDPDSLKVYKVFSNEREVSVPQSTVNGWSFANQNRREENVRSKPTRGQRLSGYFVELHGEAVVTYPECMRIETLEPLTYQGYIAIPEEPDLSSVVYKKNNTTYKESIENGWEYLGFKQNQHTRIISPTDHSAGNPPHSKNGYFFKLNGKAVYSNRDKVEISYNPKPRVRR